MPVLLGVGARAVDGTYTEGPNMISYHYYSVYTRHTITTLYHTTGNTIHTILYILHYTVYHLTVLFSLHYTKYYILNNTIPVSTYVCLCLPMSTYVYLCLPVSNNMAARTEAEIEGVFGQFHSRCGGEVELSEDRRIASGPSVLTLGSPSIAFSSAPIPRGLKFSVKVLQKSQT